MRRILLIVTLMLVVMAAFEAWFRYDYDWNWRPEEILSTKGERATITYDHQTGAYILHPVDSPESAYISSSPVQLDLYLNKPVRVYGHTELSKTTLNHGGYPNAQWDHPVAAVAITALH